MKRFSTPGLKFRSAKGFRCRVVGKVSSRSAELGLLLLLASAEDCRAISIASQHGVVTMLFPRLVSQARLFFLLFVLGIC